jgi:hypothetical protein
MKKIIHEARIDHYALYKAYLYLKKNNNRDVILVSLLKESVNNDEVREVLEVIYNYLVESGVIPEHDKEEQIK